MKYLIFCWLTILSLNSYCQISKSSTEQIFINGLLLNGGASKFYSEKNSKSFVYRPSYKIGYFAGVKRKNELSLFIFFEQKGSKKDYGGWNYQLNYLSFTPMYILPLRASEVNFMIGCYISSLINLKVEAESQNFISYTKQGFKKLDFGSMIGFEYPIWKMKDISIHISSKLNIGFYDIYDNIPYYISDFESRWDRNMSLELGVRIISNMHSK